MTARFLLSDAADERMDPTLHVDLGTDWPDQIPCTFRRT